MIESLKMLSQERARMTRRNGLIIDFTVLVFIGLVFVVSLNIGIAIERAGLVIEYTPRHQVCRLNPESAWGKTCWNEDAGWEASTVSRGQLYLETRRKFGIFRWPGHK